MKSLRKFMAVLLAMTVVAVSIMPVAAEPATQTTYLYQTEAERLHSIGLLEGVSVTEFNPGLDMQLERQAAVVMMLRLFGLKDAVISDGLDNIDTYLETKFSDADVIASWAKQSVAYAVENGLIKGYPEGNFDPKGLVTGQEYCQMMMNCLGYTGSEYEFENIAYELEKIGGLTMAQAEKYNNNGQLTRDDLAGISYVVLMAPYNDNGELVIERLVNQEVILEETVLEYIPEFASLAETPIVAPTPELTIELTTEPTIEPTIEPTEAPTVEPTPTSTPEPTLVPTPTPEPGMFLELQNNLGVQISEMSNISRTNVAYGSYIYLCFDKEIDSLSVNSANIKLLNVSVAGTVYLSQSSVSVDNNAKRIAIKILRPTSLKTGDTYQVAFKNIKTVEGGYVNDGAVKFMVSEAPEALKVLSISPSDGSVGIPVDINGENTITIKINEDITACEGYNLLSANGTTIKKGTITTNGVNALSNSTPTAAGRSIAVRNSNTPKNYLTGGIGVSSDGKTVAIYIDGLLTENATYNVEIGGGLSSGDMGKSTLAGESKTMPTYTFKTETIASTRPKIVSAAYIDSDGSGNANNGDTLTVTFNTVMNSNTIISGASNHNNSFVFSNNGQLATTNSTVVWSDNKKACTITLGSGAAITPGMTITPSSEITSALPEAIPVDAELKTPITGSFEGDPLYLGSANFDRQYSSKLKFSEQDRLTFSDGSLVNDDGSTRLTSISTYGIQEGDTISISAYLNGALIRRTCTVRSEGVLAMHEVGTLRDLISEIEGALGLSAGGVVLSGGRITINGANEHKFLKNFKIELKTSAGITRSTQFDNLFSNMVDDSSTQWIVFANFNKAVKLLSTNAHTVFTYSDYSSPGAELLDAQGTAGLLSGDTTSVWFVVGSLSPKTGDSIRVNANQMRSGAQYINQNFSATIP